MLTQTIFFLQEFDEIIHKKIQEQVIIELDKISAQLLEQNRMYWAQLSATIGVPFPPSLTRSSTLTSFPPLHLHHHHL